MKRLLVLGAAADAHVAKAMADLGPQHAQAMLLVKKGREALFAQTPGLAGNFGEKIHPGNLSLLFKLRRLAPEQILIVCGPTWFHDNIVSTLEAWKPYLTPLPELLVRVNDGPIEPGRRLHGKPTFFPLWLHLLLGLAVLAVVGLAFALAGPLYAVAAVCLGLALELCLRVFAQVKYLDFKAGDNLNVRFTGWLSHNLVEPHPELGFANVPNLKGTGRSTVEELGIRHQWSFSTGPDGWRPCSPDPAALSGRPVVAVLGSSVGFGYGVSDREHFAWKLQEGLDGHKVVNCSVPGWSMAQHLLVLERLFAAPADKPAIVLLCFWPESERQNTNPYDSMHLLARDTGLAYPSAVSTKGKLKTYKPMCYRKLAFSKSVCVVKLAESLLNRVRFAGRAKPKAITDTTRHLLLKMRKLCETHDAQLIVLHMGLTSQYHDFLKEAGFPWRVCSFDYYAVDQAGRPKYMLFPYDWHPNAHGHDQYAAMMLTACRMALSRQPIEPDLGQVTLGQTEELAHHAYIYPVF